MTTLRVCLQTQALSSFTCTYQHALPRSAVTALPALVASHCCTALSFKEKLLPPPFLKIKVLPPNTQKSLRYLLVQKSAFRLPTTFYSLPTYILVSILIKLTKIMLPSIVIQKITGLPNYLVLFKF